MVTIETIATVTEDGLLTAKAPASVPQGRHRAVIVLEDKALERGQRGAEPRPGFPDMAPFRESLGVPAYPGNTILEMREDERS